MDIKRIINFKDGFIFDLDGTLIKTTKLNFGSYRNVVDKYLGIKLSHKDFLKFFAGVRRLDALVSYTKSYKVFDLDICKKMGKSFVNEKRNLLLNNFDAVVEFIPGTEKFLDFVKSRNKKIVLATSTIREFTKIIIKSSGLDKYLDDIVTSEDVKVGKPDPEVFISAAKRIDMKVNSCIVFEDSLNGIKAAIEANFFTVGVLTPGENDACIYNADYVIQNYEHLI